MNPAFSSPITSPDSVDRNVKPLSFGKSLEEVNLMLTQEEELPGQRESLVGGVEVFVLSSVVITSVGSGVSTVVPASDGTGLRTAVVTISVGSGVGVAVTDAVLPSVGPRVSTVATASVGEGVSNTVVTIPVGPGVGCAVTASVGSGVSTSSVSSGVGAGTSVKTFTIIVGEYVSRGMKEPTGLCVGTPTSTVTFSVAPIIPVVVPLLSVPSKMEPASVKLDAEVLSSSPSYKGIFS
mmetsp:Transcript_4824/g.7905  ORF Transcript_4824/g.7905 Transcript_4824/m.7905 type:complete len:237 (-) Transcript_4824:103-813(-)